MGVLKKLGLQRKRRSCEKDNPVREADGRVATNAFQQGECRPEGDEADRTTPLERAMADAASAAACGTVVLSIIRSGLWVPEGTEETWKFEVSRLATMADIKAAIADIYDIPVRSQRLQSTPSPGDPCLGDAAIIDSAATLKRPLHLLPAEGLLREAKTQEEQYEAQMREAAEAAETLQRSLEGVVYKLHFSGPVGVAGDDTKQELTLEVPALAPMGQVQAMVQAALPGSADESSCDIMLAFNGRVLQPHIPVHFFGISDGDTLQLLNRAACSSEESTGGDDESEEDSLDDAMLTWAFN